MSDASSEEVPYDKILIPNLLKSTIGYSAMGRSRSNIPVHLKRDD